MGAPGGVTPLRVVLDTNVVLSALLFAGGRLRWLRLTWQREELKPVVSRPTTWELLRVLTYPTFRLSRAEQEQVLAEYLPFCEVATSTDAASLPPVRDAAGGKFLQRSVAAAVPFVVTGDADLLSLAGAALPAPVTIVTPEQLRQLLARSS